MPADDRYDNPTSGVVRTGAEPYACQHREMHDKRYVQDGWLHTVSNAAQPTRIPSMVRIADPMSKECRQFDRWATDPRCAGCQQPKDIDYARRMGGRGK